MTRMLFLPNDEVFIMLDTAMKPEDAVRAVNRGFWRAPEPYATAIAGMDESKPLQAIQQGRLVIITTSRPIELRTKATAYVLPEDNGEEHINLSQRQKEVLDGLVQGLTTKEIATQLGLRPRTVAMHVAALKSRLGTTTRAQSVGRAAALGLCRIEQHEMDAGLC